MRSVAYKKAIFLWLALLLVTAIAVGYKTMHVTQEDQLKLQKLLSSQPRTLQKSRLHSQEELTRQMRWKVVKKMWMSDENSRRVMQIGGSKSSLSLFVNKSEIHLVETFYDVTGVIQQQLFMQEEKPFQRFRYFEADHAVYDFQKRTLVAYNVRFKGYQAPGHEVIEDPHYLTAEAEGYANSMTIFSEGGNRQFSAENLTLRILTENSLW